MTEGEFLKMSERHVRPTCDKHEGRIRDAESRLDKMEAREKLLRAMAAAVFAQLAAIIYIIIELAK